MRLSEMSDAMFAKVIEECIFAVAKGSEEAGFTIESAGGCYAVDVRRVPE